MNSRVPRPLMDPAHGLRRIRLQPHQMTERITARDDVFVIGHFGIPRVDPASWSLTLDGLLDRPVTLRLDELKARPKKTIVATHQCCGNPLEPQLPTRRITNVRWGGVDLRALLEECGIGARARFIWSYGLDGGDFAGTDCEWYVKDLPLARLAAGDVLIAYEMNDAPLDAEHGFPARLVVPGYYGTNSVKWLCRLHLAERRAEGMFVDRLYNDAASAREIAAGLASRRPVWAIAPESAIVAPAPGASVALGEPVEIWGWAWSFGAVARVEVSVDGGASFVRAALEPRDGWAWQRFSWLWRPAAPGAVQLCARASGENGMAQPETGARNAIHTVPLTVR